MREEIPPPPLLYLSAPPLPQATKHFQLFNLIGTETASVPLVVEGGYKSDGKQSSELFHGASCHIIQQISQQQLRGAAGLLCFGGLPDSLLKFKIKTNVVSWFLQSASL